MKPNEENVKLKIEYMKIDDLKPYERNTRKHDAKDVEIIKNSIKEFGMCDPIGIWGKKNLVVEGHGRLMALKELGYKKVPVMRLDHLSDKERRAYGIAHNKTAEMSEWDKEMLALELEDLGTKIDMNEFGFDLSEKNETEKLEKVPKIRETKIKQGDMFILGNHRLLCGDATSQADVDRLVGNTEIDLVFSDPPYNVDVTGGTDETLKIENDNMSAEAFQEFITNAMKCMLEPLKAGGSFYIWHASKTQREFENAINEAGLEVRQQIIWVKNHFTLGRQDYQWCHELCQPKGTLVRCEGGIDKPIEELTNDDKVMTWCYNGQVQGYKKGYAIKVGQREYDGKMYEVCCDGKKTKATDNHIFSVRFNKETENWYCTYLMKKGKWWRVGRTKIYNHRGHGVRCRLKEENGDAAWIIDIFKTKQEAQMGEQLLAVKYGIPYTHWETNEKYLKEGQRGQKEIKWLYENLDLAKLENNAKELLKNYHRSYQYPIVTKDYKRGLFSRKNVLYVRACNIIPKIMSMPVPYKKWDSWKCKTSEWKPIDKVKVSDYKGMVYNLDVEKHHHYIADGLITHNCYLGFKEGAAHYFTEDRTLSTVIDDIKPKLENLEKKSKEELLEIIEKWLEIPKTVIRYDKPVKNEDHPTMKPIDMCEYLIKNSTRPNENVLDCFGGSGSTLIACEQSNRNALLIEIDPKYVQSIIDRYIELTENEDGVSYIQPDGTPIDYKEWKKQ